MKGPESFSRYEKPSVSVIIPVFNGGNQFRMCLASLGLCSSPPLEIIVVADGESDGSWRVAQALGYKVIVLEQSHGPAFARNIGAREASGDILLFIDADVSVSPNIIDTVQDVFDNNPDVAAIIGSYDDEPFEKNFLSQYKNLIHHYVHQQSNETASTFWGACGAIRKTAFDHVKGFDIKYRNPCIEDIELGYRLVAAGYTIRLEKSIFIKHLKRWDIKSLLKADIFYRALPWSALIIEKKLLVNDLNLTLSSRLSVALVMISMGLLSLMSFFPILGICAIGCILSLVILNKNIYLFFIQKRGIIFTMGVVPWHWLYYLYSGLAFAMTYIKLRTLRCFDQ